MASETENLEERFEGQVVVRSGTSGFRFVPVAEAKLDLVYCPVRGGGCSREVTECIGVIDESLEVPEAHPRYDCCRIYEENLSEFQRIAAESERV